MKYYLSLVLGLVVCLGCGEPKQATGPETGDGDKASPVASQNETDEKASEGESPTEDSKVDDDKVTGKQPDQAAIASEADSAAEMAVDANQVLDRAIAKAKEENKALFVHFTADW